MTNLAGKIKQGWQRFWFRPEHPLALGICRIVLYGLFIFWIAPTNFAFCATLSKFSWQPISFYKIVSPQGPPSEAVLQAMQAIWRISLVTSLLGLCTRFSTVAACLLGVYLTGLPYNFGKTNHDTAAASIGLIVMAMSYCGRYASLDQLIASFRGVPFAPVPNAEYRWPLQLMKVVICFIFFAAGLSKLRTSGLAWISSENLQMNLLHCQTPLGFWMAQFPWLCWFFAAFTIIVEFLHPVALFSRRLALLWVPAGLSLLVGIYFAMDISFLALIVAHVFWVPWNFLFVRKNADASPTP